MALKGFQSDHWALSPMSSDITAHNHIFQAFELNINLNIYCKQRCMEWPGNKARSSGYVALALQSVLNHLIKSITFFSTYMVYQDIPENN